MLKLNDTLFDLDEKWTDNNALFFGKDSREYRLGRTIGSMILRIRAKEILIFSTFGGVL